jgi:hypothetical protein
MSQLVAPAKRYAQSGEINFQIEEPDAALEALHEDYLDVADIDELDGITIDASPATGGGATSARATPSPCCASTPRPPRPIPDRLGGGVLVDPSGRSDATGGGHG